MIDRTVRHHAARSSMEPQDPTRPGISPVEGPFAAPRPSSAKRCKVGFSVEGPGFYVWDEFASQANRGGAELLSAVPSSGRGKPSGS